MKPVCLYVLSSLLVVTVPSVASSPVKFDDTESPQEHVQGRALSQHEEGRVFHAHAIKKRKKKKLLHCLLSLQRSNPQGDPRTLFFNYVNVEYNQHGGNGGSGAYNDDNGNGNYNNCLNQFGGGSYGGGDSDGGLGGIGEGINNLGSLVSQVPSNLISSVGDGIKPVFENPERYLNRYIIRPLYRSLRPLYRLF